MTYVIFTYANQNNRWGPMVTVTESAQPRKRRGDQSPKGWTIMKCLGTQSVAINWINFTLPLPSYPWPVLLRCRWVCLSLLVSYLSLHMVLSWHFIFNNCRYFRTTLCRVAAGTMSLLFSSNNLCCTTLVYQTLRYTGNSQRCRNSSLLVVGRV